MQVTTKLDFPSGGSSVPPSPLVQSIDMVQLLRQNSLFNSIGAATQDGGGESSKFVEELARTMHLRHYQIGDLVIREGDIGKAMFLVMRGWVTVSSKDGEMIFADLGPGKFFGEIGILFDIPRTANVVAKTKCMLSVLTQAELINIIKQYPEIADEM